jgi:GntR family transcriptional regulator, transcriptional repressor for pyruvate dehydrogenase complex
MFDPVPVRRAREQVESQLKEAILSGAFEVGSRLPTETELAERFGVSRTTIRESLRVLASSGLITKVPGASGGSFVRAVDHQSLGSMFGESMETTLRFGRISYDEVAQMRRLLEIPAARLAAENRTEEDLQRLRQIVEQQKSITVEDPGVPGLDMSFHGGIAEASKNRVLTSVVSALHWAIRPVLFVRISPEVGKTTVLQHLAVVQAISEKNPSAAAEAMEEHLNYLESLRHPPQSPLDGSP